jgi:putative transposase
MGAPKICEKLIRCYPDVHAPAIRLYMRFSIVMASSSRGKGDATRGTALSQPHEPNDLWCADYKGEFMLADRRIAILLQSAILPAVISSRAKRSQKTKESYTVCSRPLS